MQGAAASQANAEVSTPYAAPAHLAGIPGRVQVGGHKGGDDAHNDASRTASKGIGQSRSLLGNGAWKAVNC
eukprot:1155134-Pelagomonas_calceolata.AAC.2